MDFKIIDGNSVVFLTKAKTDSIDQFIKKTSFYLKAKNNIDDSMATMMSMAYINKLKYNLTYNINLESKIQLILDS